MKRASAVKPERCQSSCILRYVKIFVVSLVPVVLVGFPLLPLFALMVILPRLCLIGESLGALLWLFGWVIRLITYSILLLLARDWGQFVGLLLEFLDWLGSVGLL